jgi:hypothetical protein
VFADVGDQVERLDVTHVDRHLCEVRHCGAIRFDNSSNVFQYLRRLGPDIAFTDKFAVGSKRNLSGNEE